MITTGDVLRACDMHKQSVKYHQLRRACRQTGVWLKREANAWYFQSKEDVHKVLNYLNIEIEKE